MAKRSSDSRKSVINDTIVFVDPTVYNAIEQMQVRSKFPARLKYIGQATGKQYIWDQAGSVVSVNVEDVQELLTKRIGESSCCGASQRGNLLFELV